jgi:thymidylate kinase
MLSVAFTGQDGTGKSTQMALLRERLLEEGKTVAVVHQYGPTTAVGRGIAPWAKGVANRFMRAPNNPLRPAMAWCAASASLTVGLRRSRRNWEANHGRDVLILDRFFGDEIVRAAHKFGTVPAWGYRALRDRVPRPDVAFAFTLDPRTGWERKKTRELSLEEYAAKTGSVNETLAILETVWPLVVIPVDELAPAAVFERVWVEVRNRLGS